MALPDEPAKPPAPEYPSEIEALADLLGDEIVVVIVGESSKKYHLHKKLLCYHSPFFAAAFNGAFQEGISGQMRLPEEDINAFDAFVHWLYRGVLPQCCDLQKPSSTPFNFLLVYSMGEKWFIPRLQDIVCDQLRLWDFDFICLSCAFFKSLYDAMSPGCKLRQYFVRKFVVSALENPIAAENILEQNGDFAIDVAKEMILRLSISPRQRSEFQIRIA